jgi:hypothetical protein
LFSTSKKGGDKLENIPSHFDSLNEKIKDLPVCFIIYPNFKQTIPHEYRIFLKEQYPKYFKAVAHITYNKMMALWPLILFCK